MACPSRLLVAISCLVISGCADSTDQSQSGTANAAGRQRIHLYVSRLPNKVQIYYYSLEETPPPGYSPTTDTPELVGGNFFVSATLRPGMVPIYAFTIAAKTGELVHYLSTKKEAPTSFSGGKIQFYAYDTPQPETTPVYLYTTGDSNETQVYYYSTSATKPPGLRAEGIVFHVFANK